MNWDLCFCLKYITIGGFKLGSFPKFANCEGLVDIFVVLC